MKWLYKEENCTQQDIEQIETTFGIKLPLEYKELICQNNGAYPELRNYKIGDDEKIVQALLSCKKDDDSNIIEVSKNINILGLVPFMSDPFGNYICFQFGLNDDYNVVLFSHEDKNISIITTNFTGFIEILY